MNKTVKNLLLTPFNVLYKVSPKATLGLLFRIKCKSTLNFDAPTTYLEKMNWLLIPHFD